MVRGKTQMKRIENTISRLATFTKRRNGLLKKAYELSVLCDAEIGIMIFSPRGKLHEFARPSMHKMLERYHDTNGTSKEQDNEDLNRQIANMKDRIRILESTQRKIMGEGLGTCSLEELTELEVQVGQRLNHIREQKTEMLMAQVKQLKTKVEISSEENKFLLKSMLK
jgi:hypothetical protein